MNSPPSLCLSTCPRWCHINPPSRVTNQPPADAAPVRHRGSLTCALALQTRLAGLLCGEAKNAPWTATGKRPVRSWDGFELPKADALGAVIGRFLGRPLDRPYNFECAVGGGGPRIVGGPFESGGQLVDQLFVVPRSPWECSPCPKSGKLFSLQALF
jgi:hypothetical protein